MRKYFYFLRILMALFALLVISTRALAYDPNRIIRPLPIGTTDPLPEGWKFKDIGNIKPPSDWCYYAEQDLYYIKAYGEEVFGNRNDECAFIYFETDEDKQVSCRIMDAEVVLGSAAKGFIMVRGGLEAGDPMAYIEVKTQGNVACFCWRLNKVPTTDYDGPCFQTGTNGSTFNPPNCYPRWLKFIRQGLYLQAFHRDDVEGAQWVKLDRVIKLQLKGKAYMGIGACAVYTNGGDPSKPAFYIFDNLEVKEIEVPYEVLYNEKVTASFLEPIKPGKSKDIEITQIFGHALGEYFTIDCQSIDPSVASAYFWEREEFNKSTGEEFTKYVRITGISEGVTSIRMTTTINGYTMSTDYAVNISDGKAKPKTASVTPPYGWEIKNLEVPANPDMTWGEPFVNKRLSLQKKFPVFVGAWEYDWSVYNDQGVADGGNYGAGDDPLQGKTSSNDGPPLNTKHNAYIAGAQMYNFRDLSRNYPISEGYPGYAERKEIKGGSSIDLSCLIANDTAGQVTKTDFISIDKGSDGKYIWSTSTGFWTELLGVYDQSGQKVRGYPYLANLSSGDWAAYTVDAPRAGYYSLYPMAAIKTVDVSNKPFMQVYVNGVLQVENMEFVKSTTTSDWKKGSSGNILLRQGKNQIKVIFKAPELNFLGLRISFATASKEPYGGINYNGDKYGKSEMSIDLSLMTEDEVTLYNKCLDGTYADIYPLWDADSVDVFIRSLPMKDNYLPAKVIAAFKNRIKANLSGSSQNDTLNYIKNKLALSLDTFSVVTTQQSAFAHMDQTTFMYKEGIDPTKKIEISMKIDSVANAGKGTYMGIMLRSLYFDGTSLNVASNSEYASFGIGSYEGGRLSYRWAYDTKYRKFDNEDIAHNVYIKIRINEFTPGYMTVYYSYDNLYWWEFAKDPLKIEFLNSKGLNNIAAGIFLTGGNFANDATLALARARNFEIKELADDESFDNMDAADEMFNMPLEMVNTNLKKGDQTEILFNVTKPGLVSLNIYNSYGVLVQTIKNLEYMEFSKEAVSIPFTPKLGETGVYLLRLEAPNNEQYIRFRYTN